MTLLKPFLLTALAYLIGCSVLLASVHAKDLASHNGDSLKISTLGKVRHDDISVKVINDLHTHVDKAALKVFTNTFNEQPVMHNERQLRSVKQRFMRTLDTMAIEALLMFRLALAVR